MNEMINAIRQALARAYYAKVNEKKILDPDLIEVMVGEVLAILPQQPAEEETKKKFLDIPILKCPLILDKDDWCIVKGKDLPCKICNFCFLPEKPKQELKIEGLTNMLVINHEAYREMMMSSKHSREQCLRFYAREGIEVIEYMGEYGGYHHFKEYYAPEKINELIQRNE